SAFTPPFNVHKPAAEAPPRSSKPKIILNIQKSVEASRGRSACSLAGGGAHRCDRGRGVRRPRSPVLAGPACRGRPCPGPERTGVLFQVEKLHRLKRPARLPLTLRCPNFALAGSQWGL